MTDQALIAAWERWREAHIVFETLPYAEEGDVTNERGETLAEAEQWRLIDEAEIVIQGTKATTAAGVAAQLWVALSHAPGLTDRKACEAAFRGDLAWFEANESDFDWDTRLIFAALRSLSGMTSR